MTKKKKKKLARVGGNFRRVTPKVAKRYVDQWAKKGVLTPNDIPDQGSPEATRLAKIRLREAQYVLNNFDRRKAEYEERLAKYKQELEIYEAAKKSTTILANGLEAKVLRPEKPTMPKFTGPSSKRGGNFKKVTKAQAVNYLRRVFRKPPQGHAPVGAKGHKTLKAKQFLKIEDLTAMKPGYHGDLSAPRIQEAIEVAGMETTLKLFNQAKEAHARAVERAAKRALAAEKRKATMDKKKVEKLEKCAQKHEAAARKCREDMRKIPAIVTAARRRAKRSMRRRARGR